ncbi:MAG: IS481 family transposase [Gammaproteobacteria bacterium]
MDKQIKARTIWVNLYLETKDAGYVCRKCGISRPTLRKWYRRYLADGLQGLNEQSRKPHSSPAQKLTPERIKSILDLRSKRNLGARRIQTELIRLHDYSLSLASIHKALTMQQAQPLKKLRRKKKFKRYCRPIPGDRIQMDTCKIAPGIYQYTAVDDCSRWRVLEIYKRRNANNTLHFLDLLIEQFPFPIQRIQTDRGLEFFAEKVQHKLMELGIKFRPNKPGSPHLNGKVERSQKTDLEEFYATVDLYDFENLREELAQWQFFYNWQRPHGSLKGKTPSEIVAELGEKTPFSDEVLKKYNVNNERIQIANYQIDLAMRKLK